MDLEVAIDTDSHGRSQPRGIDGAIAAIAERQHGVVARRQLSALGVARGAVDTDLPRPSVNARVESFEVDFAWHEQRLIAELDGYAFHATRGAFERDRARDRRLQARGWRVVRITWRQLHHHPAPLAAELAALLSRHRT